MSLRELVIAFGQVLGENLLEKIAPAAPLLAVIIGGPTALIPLALVYPIAIVVAAIAPYIANITYLAGILQAALQIFIQIIGYPNCALTLALQAIRYNEPLEDVKLELQELSGNPAPTTDIFTTAVELLFSRDAAFLILNILRLPVPSSCGF